MARARPPLRRRVAVLVAAALLSACTGEDAPVAPPAAGPSGPAVAGLTGADAELLAAAYANDLPRAEAAVRAGGDVDAQDESQQSAFLIATSEVGDDARLLELALSAGADVTATDSFDGTGLIRAAERGHPRVVSRLLEAGTPVDHVNRLGWTALLEAVVLGDGGPAHVETVRLLLDGGADLDLPDRDGVTALAHARERGQRQVAALLEAAGAQG